MICMICVACSDVWFWIGVWVGVRHSMNVKSWQTLNCDSKRLLLLAVAVLVVTRRPLQLTLKPNTFLIRNSQRTRALRVRSIRSTANQTLNLPRRMCNCSQLRRFDAADCSISALEMDASPVRSVSLPSLAHQSLTDVRWT